MKMVRTKHIYESPKCSTIALATEGGVLQTVSDLYSIIGIEGYDQGVGDGGDLDAP